MAEDGPRSRRRAKQSRSALTRAAIFDTAAQLFASKGFSGTTIRDIASGAGVNQGLVSYYFGSKGALYDEILTEAVTHAAAQLDALSSEADTGLLPEQRLVQIFGNAFTTRPYLAPMIMREQLDPAHFLDPAAVERLRGFMALTERVLDSIPLAPEARGYDPQIVHLICVGPIIHFLIARRIREAAADKLNAPISKPPLSEMVQTLGEILCAGLRQPVKN